MRGHSAEACHWLCVALWWGCLLAGVDATRLSLRTLGAIMANFFSAFVSNVAEIELVAFGLLDPSFVGAAMVSSSAFVVSNNLQLRRFGGVQ